MAKFCTCCGRPLDDHADVGDCTTPEEGCTACKTEPNYCPHCGESFGEVLDVPPECASCGKDFRED